MAEPLRADGFHNALQRAGPGKADRQRGHARLVLAHVEGGVKGVYNKAEYLEERVKLMHWWSKYLTSLYIPDNHSDLG